MTRRNARELIMQLLYEYTFHTKEDAERLLQEKLDEIKETDDGSNKAAMKFVQEIYFGVLQNLDAVDEIIKKSAVNWSTSRIAKVDFSILRLAVYEINWREDVPNKAAVNEALEIAKKYSTDKSAQFINGILGNVIKLIEG
jgi:N utilization substance protein B